MRKTDFIAVGIALLVCGQTAQGTEADVLLDKLRHAHPSTRFDTIHPSPIPGLYEVRMGPSVAYVSAKQPGYFLFGHLYDTLNGKDLTGAIAVRLGPSSQQAALGIADLPLSDAIASRHGKGTDVLVVFTDPACPFCQRLEAELSTLADVTIYRFMVPFLGADLPRKVWCTSDRLASLQAAMLGKLPSSSAGRCADPLDRNQELAARMGIQGTPTIILPSGERMEGFATAADIKRSLAAIRKTAAVSRRSEP
ncbi:DsbC family protein [Massilia sp. YMA4]|uniref:Thiol:disulfide interchange protein n=1 Tax=[Empedobacter] haloabium TaxID=592317 RepID=A0ABZ1US86_9BURK|nr:DsbC family protein [Massilia sp. YMA4]AXA91339.1 DsbC family protein [Massilia sp. YMA4]